AIEPLTRANGIYDRFPGAGTAAAETQLALARALWDGGGDRQRARRLAESAPDICVKLELPERAALAERWLASHTVGERKEAQGRCAVTSSPDTWPRSPCTSG